MFRTLASSRRLLRSKFRPFKRLYNTGLEPPLPEPPIRLLGPTLWSIATCSGIYLGFATYEVYQDAKHAGAEEGRRAYKMTFAELERYRDEQSTNALVRSIRTSPSERPEFSGSQGLAWGFIGLSTLVHLASTANSTLAYRFMHAPALSANYTLLTSVFGHSGIIHLGVNMYAMLQLIPGAASSRNFEQSNTHLAAFFLSAGILSSLANHAAAIWPGGRSAYMPALGASGALFALFGVVGVSFPDTPIGILFVPGSVPILDAMGYVALFDMGGLIVEYPLIRLAHAAHLGGLALGFVYGVFNTDKTIWRPGRKLAFRTMRYLGVV
ncbi:rhomboid-domain-containing protein [Hypoxylon argillaceum]|nr:rhomboid-domain-containing protein [Hypoxylon argillaceum]KAI1156394.1 rhomboid-domain-containing protein [Nemania diffusa]